MIGKIAFYVYSNFRHAVIVIDDYVWLDKSELESKLRRSLEYVINHNGLETGFVAGDDFEYKMVGIHNESDLKG